MGHYGTMGGKTDLSRHTIEHILIRDYVLSFLGFFAFSVTYHALTPTLPIYLARLGSHEREIGILIGTISVSALVSRLLAGKLLLMYSEKIVMMWGVILFGLSFLALIVFRPFWPFFVVRFLQGIAFACLDTSVIAYVVRIIPDTYRARAISYFLLAASIASAIASSTAVFVVNQYGFTVLLFACTGLSLCTFLLFLKLKDETAPPSVASPARNMLLFEPKIIAPAMISFLIFFSWGGVLAFFPLYALQCGVTNPGYFFSVNAAMLILVRIFGGQALDTYPKEKMIPRLLLLSLACLVLLALSTTLPMFLFVGMLWGVGGGYIAPVAMAYALECAGSSDGAAVATYQAFRDLGLALGPVTMGLIVPFTGYRIMFFCLAFTCFINLVYFQLYLRKTAHAKPQSLT